MKEKKPKKEKRIKEPKVKFSKEDYLQYQMLIVDYLNFRLTPAEKARKRKIALEFANEKGIPLLQKQGTAVDFEQGLEDAKQRQKEKRKEKKSKKAAVL